MLHTSVKERRGWEHWVIGRFMGTSDEYIIASSGSRLHLYFPAESSLTRARRLIYLANHELYSTILCLSTLDISMDNCIRTLLLAVDDGGRLSIHRIQCETDTSTSTPSFHCILTHRVSRSGIRHNCPWRVSGSFGYIIVLLLDATVLIFRLRTKEKDYGDNHMLLEIENEMFLLPPIVVNLSNTLAVPINNDKLNGPKQPCHWEVPQLVSLDLCIILLSEPCCIVLVKDTYTGLHLLFRFTIADTLSAIHYLIVHPSIITIKTISTGLIGFGKMLVLCLSSDFLNTDWLPLYPLLHAHRDSTSSFEYAEEGELLININALSSSGISSLDPLRVVGCALFGTYLAIDIEPTDPSLTRSLVFAQEVQFNRHDKCSHVWLLSEIGEFISVIIPTNQSNFALHDILFVSSTKHTTVSSASTSNITTDQFILHSTGSLSIHAVLVGTLQIDCIGGFLLTSGFLGCITPTGNLLLYRISDLPKGHVIASYPLISQLLQYSTYKNGHPVYPVLHLLQLLTYPFICKKSESVTTLLSSVLLQEYSLLDSDIIASAITLSAPICADTQYIIANKTALSLYSLSVPTMRVYSGPLLKEEQSLLSSITLHQVMLGSIVHLIFSYSTSEFQKKKTSICLITGDTGLEFALHYSSIVYSPSIQSILCTDVLKMDLIHISESPVSQSNTTPICLDGRLLNIYMLHSDLILQVFEGDEPYQSHLIFISACHSSIRKILNYGSQMTEYDEHTDDSSFDFSINKRSSNRTRKFKYDDDDDDDDKLSDNGNNPLESHTYLIFNYKCSLNAPLVSVLYCISTSVACTQICFQTQTGLIKLSINTTPLYQLQLQKDSNSHVLHISRYLPTFAVDSCIVFNQSIKQSCNNLVHAWSDLFLYTTKNILSLCSNSFLTSNSTSIINQTMGNTDYDPKCMPSSYILGDKQYIIYIHLSIYWSVFTTYRYVPVFVVATDGLHICYIDRNEEKLMDMKSIIALFNLKEYFEPTVSIFTKDTQLLFSNQNYDLNALKVHPLSATKVIFTCDSLTSYLLTFLIVDNCPIPNQLHRINFSITSLIFISSLTVSGYLSNYLLAVTADSQFHVFEPLDGIPCSSLTSVKVFAEDKIGLSTYGLTVLKGGYCACIVKPHSDPSKTSLLVIKVIGKGRTQSNTDLEVKYTLPVKESTRILSYNYSSGRLSWATGRSIYTIDNIVKLVSQQIKELCPACYSISDKVDITALCDLGQSSDNNMCIGLLQTLLIYNTVTKEIIAHELLPDAIIRLVALDNSRIVVVMNKAGLAVFSFSQSKRMLTLELTDSVPMRVVTAILPITPDVIIIGDRFGSISVLTCTPDNRYHQMSVSKKLSLYAETSVGSPVVSLTAEPQRGKASIIVHYTLFTGEIGKIELTTNKKLFANLLCDQEIAHKNGLYKPTRLMACESHRRFRCGIYSFVNTVDITFLTQLYRMDLLE